MATYTNLRKETADILRMLADKVENDPNVYNIGYRTEKDVGRYRITSIVKHIVEVDLVELK